MIPKETHLEIGSLLFEGVDQIDLTGPVRGPRPHPERDLSNLRQNNRTRARSQRPAIDAGRGHCGRAATRRAPCARWLWPGSGDGRHGGARLDQAPGRWRA